MKTQTSANGTGAANLGLRTVLVDSLSPALMTDDAPERYTVEAVFTRRPERDEVTAILGTATNDALKAAGYPSVELAVSDRRLAIAHTTLEELRDGLATVVADRLAEISAEVRARLDAEATRFKNAVVAEQIRAESVATLAESVEFRTSIKPQVPTPSRYESTVSADTDQIDTWTDEGGDQHAPTP